MYMYKLTGVMRVSLFRSFLSIIIWSFKPVYAAVFVINLYPVHVCAAGLCVWLCPFVYIYIYIYIYIYVNKKEAV